MSELESKLQAPAPRVGDDVARCRWEHIRHWNPETLEVDALGKPLRVTYNTGDRRYVWRRSGASKDEWFRESSTPEEASNAER